MSTFLYSSARTSFATAEINFLTADIRIALTNANYAPQPTHVVLSDVGAGNLIVRDVVLGSKNVVDGICSGLIPPFNAFIEVPPIIGLVMYILGSDDSHSPLIYYSDDGIGFPFNAQGFNYSISYDLTSGGFFEV